MKEQEFKLLAQTGVIQSVVIMLVTCAEDPGWEVWAYGGDDLSLPAYVSNPVKTARGALRLWVSLDTAYKWVRGAGFKGPVTIEEPFSKSPVAGAHPPRP